MGHEVFLFDLLEKKREPMHHLKAVCYLRPTRENVELLRKEFSNPKYSEYNLFFSNTISKDSLRDMAEADEHEVVKQVHEYFIDYFPHFSSLFSLHMKSLIASDPDTKLKNAERMCDGLAAVLLSLKKKPLIRYQGNSKKCQSLAQDITRKMGAERGLFDYSRTESTTVLLIIDRTGDPVTPLLAQWTYQAMVHEYFGIDNDTVDLKEYRKQAEEKKRLQAEGSSSEEKPEKKKQKGDQTKDHIVLSPSQDQFFLDNMFENWGQLGINVQEAMKEVQQKDQRHQVQTIEDMKQFMENFPEFNRLKGNVAKHVTLLGDLLDVVNGRNMLDVSELEQELAVKDDHESAKTKVYNLLRDRKVTPMNKVKLVILYSLRYENHPDKETSRMMNLLPNCGASDEEVGLIPIVLKTCGTSSHAHDLFGSQKSFTDKFIGKVAGLKGVENIYIQHKPLLNRIIEELFQGTLREDLFPVHSSSPGNVGKMALKDVIVFFYGGITYEESVFINKMNKNPAEFNLPPETRIIGGGNFIHNSKTFLGEMEIIRRLSNEF